MIEIMRVMNSENGMVNQIPFTPRKIGKRITPIMTRIKLLKTEISADTFPLEKAVNIAEAKILIPIGKKLKENR